MILEDEYPPDLFFGFRFWDIRVGGGEAWGGGHKGPVKLIKWVKIAHTVGVKSVPRYHFKLAYVVLQMAV